MRNDIKDKLYMVLEFCLTSLQALLDSVPEKKLPASQAHQYVLFIPIHSFIATNFGFKTKQSFTYSTLLRFLYTGHVGQSIFIFVLSHNNCQNIVLKGIVVD